MPVAGGCKPLRVCWCGELPPASLSDMQFDYW